MTPGAFAFLFALAGVGVIAYQCGRAMERLHRDPAPKPPAQQVTVTVEAEPAQHFAGGPPWCPDCAALTAHHAQANPTEAEQQAYLDRWRESRA